MPYDYDVRCPDCGAKAQYFAVWKTVNFYCEECQQPKSISLLALGGIGKQLHEAFENGEYDLDCAERVIAKVTTAQDAGG